MATLPVILRGARDERRRRIFAPGLNGFPGWEILRVAALPQDDGIGLPRDDGFARPGRVGVGSSRWIGPAESPRFAPAG